MKLLRVRHPEDKEGTERYLNVRRITRITVTKRPSGGYKWEVTCDSFTYETTGELLAQAGIIIQPTQERVQ